SRDSSQKRTNGSGLNKTSGIIKKPTRPTSLKNRKTNIMKSEESPNSSRLTSSKPRRMNTAFLGLIAAGLFLSGCETPRKTDASVGNAPSTVEYRTVEFVEKSDSKSANV